MILVTEEIKLSNPEIKIKILMGSFKGNIEVAQTIYMLKCKPVYPFLISYVSFSPKQIEEEINDYCQSISIYRSEVFSNVLEFIILTSKRSN